jgi:hypothetical protein
MVVKPVRYLTIYTVQFYFKYFYIYLMTYLVVRFAAQMVN